MAVMPDAQPQALVETVPVRSGASSAQPAARPDGSPALRIWQPPRWLVRKLGCPTCLAEAGQPCQGRRGDRAAHHLARVELVWPDELREPRAFPPDWGGVLRSLARRSAGAGAPDVREDVTPLAG